MPALSSTISAGEKFASNSRRPAGSSAPAISWNASTARSAALCRGARSRSAQSSRMRSTSSSVSPSRRAPAKRIALQMGQSMRRALRMRAISLVV